MEANQEGTPSTEKSTKKVDIHYKSTPYDDGKINYEELTAEENGNELGRLVYYWNGDEKYWKIEDIEVNAMSQGTGMSKLLLGSFVQRVGVEAPVQSIIIHQPTLDLLEDKHQLATSDASYDLPPEIAQNLPIVKIFNSGGIGIHRAVISHDMEDQGTTLTVFGVTYKRSS